MFIFPQKRRIEKAIKIYQSIIFLLNREFNLTDTERKMKNDLMVAAYLKLASSEIKLDIPNYLNVIKLANECLVIDPNNASALFRRAQVIKQIAYSN